MNPVRPRMAPTTASSATALSLAGCIDESDSMPQTDRLHARGRPAARGRFEDALRGVPAVRQLGIAPDVAMSTT